MTKEEAEKYAKVMTYRDAVYNALQGKCIPYRKATLIKLYELLDRLEQQPMRDATEEERKSVKDYIESISKPTGVHFDEAQPSEDCISRESLRQKLQENYDFFVNAYGGFSNLPQNDKARVDEINNCIAMVVNEPSVTPQRPKGRWIGHGEHCENLGVMPSGLGAYEWCSNCDCGIDVREWHRNHYNFCPNCGAYMGGADD